MGYPIYILSRHAAPGWAADWPLVRYVDDIGRAMSAAKERAGSRDVLAHGAGIARLALAAGVLDEIEIHLVPVLLGEGRLLFDHLGLGPQELERVRVLEGENGITHLRFRVCR
ncbi:dihydrofolate reductase family protein [Devosia sediminis]|uniref:dihydrofolate reductase family protein n=1 Tax=Devosia sediminis TaxID=2798801 RepID=UPI001F339DB7|nr:dihydrofolate reductase family protein [Devosia sediminis]